jgi:hypothetical protein
MNISRRSLLVAGGSTAALLGAGISPGVASTRQPRPAGGAAGTVIEWNRILLRIVRAPAVQPATVHPTRSFAMLHAAMHDAVVAVHGRGRPHLLDVARSTGGSAEAAAAQAAHDTLVALYPGAAADLGRRLDGRLAAVYDRRARAVGARLGTLAARLVVAQRAGDGSAANPQEFKPGTLAGQFRPTPLGFEDAAFTHWPKVTPFVIDRADQFCPAPYPALTSARHAEAIAEVKRIGKANSEARTADQTDQARFWSAPSQNFWYEIAQSAVAAHRVDLMTAARVFNDLSRTFADATIACYEAKYHHQLWRPMTAIRREAQTEEDIDWTPLVTNPNVPSYPSAHSVIAQAGASVLAHHFGNEDRVTVNSEATNTVRSFRSFQAVADEAGLSRISAGIHSRLDHESGQPLGLAVAQLVLNRRIG